MRGFRNWRWHLDEMVVRLNGEYVCLWRAVDHEGEVLGPDTGKRGHDCRQREQIASLESLLAGLKAGGTSPLPGEGAGR